MAGLISTGYSAWLGLDNWLETIGEVQPLGVEALTELVSAIEIVIKIASEM